MTAFLNSIPSHLTNSSPTKLGTKSFPICSNRPFSYQLQKVSNDNRFPKVVTNLVAVASAAMLTWFSITPACAVISAPQCIRGEGPGCDAAAADESPIVRDLLKKSRENKEITEKKLLEDYWARGYGDYFSFGYNKVLTRDEDGKWKLEEPDDLLSRGERYLKSKMKK